MYPFDFHKTYCDVPHFWNFKTANFSVLCNSKFSVFVDAISFLDSSDIEGSYFSLFSG